MTMTRRKVLVWLCFYVVAFAVLVAGIVYGLDALAWVDGKFEGLR